MKLLHKALHRIIADWPEGDLSEKQQARVDKALKAPVREELWSRAVRDIKKRGLFWGDDSGSIVDVWINSPGAAELLPEKIYTIRIGSKLIAWAGIGAEAEPWMNVYVARMYRGKGLAVKVAEKAIINSDHENINCFKDQFEKGCDLIKKHGLKAK